MEKIDLDTILERNEIKSKIYEYLQNFENEKVRGLYIYGDASIGKTRFIKKLLKDKYTIIYLDALDQRNKHKIEEINNTNMTTETIFNKFYKKKKIVIVFDDIETMNSGDKGGINSLVKLLKNKKRMVNSEYLVNPVICINNYYTDKKINDLKKHLIPIEIKKPTAEQIYNLCKEVIPCNEYESLVENIDGNLNRLKIHLDNYNIFGKIIMLKTYNKSNSFYKVTDIALSNKLYINNYKHIIKETDKTSISLLFHENVIDLLKMDNIKLYLKLLSNICFGDYIDRQIFQYQLWDFNEISFIIKLIINNNILAESNINIIKLKNIRFTKVLTKYSSEYSNSSFINELCQKFNMDRNDLYLFFNVIRNTKTPIEIYKYFEDTELKPLEVKRLYRFLDMEL
jgi:GTPase SAR1 family protein